MKEKETKAYIMLIVSMMIFASIGIFRRYIPLSSGLLACIRGFLGALFLHIFMMATGRRWSHTVRGKKLLLLFLSGGIMGFNWIFLFEAYNYTTVATATLCYYMEPTIIILVSPFLFREKLTWKRGLCALLSLLGMIFVSGILETKNGGSNDLLGVAFGLGAAVFYSIVVIMNKKIQTDSEYEKTLVQLLGAAICIIPYVLLTEDLSTVSLDTMAVIMILILGIAHTGVGFTMYFGSMGALKAQSIAVLSYIDPIGALLLSAVILNEKMSLLGIVGAVLIIGSALISELNLPKIVAKTK